MNQIPDHWVVASLGDITDYGAAKQVRPDQIMQDSWVLELEDVERDSSKLLQRVTFQERQSKSNKSKFELGDVLYGKLRPYLNKVILADRSGYCTTEIVPITPVHGIESKWVFYALKQPAFIRHVAALCRGINMPRLTTDDARGVEIAVPPTNEQRRIVAKLDALFEKSRTIRDKLGSLPHLLANLQKSILNSAFRGDLTKEWRANNPNVEPAGELLKRIRAERRARWEADLIARGKDPKKLKYVEPEPVDAEGLPELPEGWCWAPNSLLAEDRPGSICAGPFGTIFKAKDFRTSGIPIIFLRHVGEGKYLTHKPGFMDEEVWKELHQPYSIFGGELLVTKLGDPPGTACIYPQDAGVAMVTPDVMKMSVNGEFADAQYLMHFFNSPISKGILRKLAFGVTRLRIDLAMFKSFPIPLAPREEQKVILHRINELFEKAKKITSNVDVIGARLNTTTSSVLSKAFRGELVPQDPNDEPASVLLERIRTQKPAAGTKRGRGRKAVAVEESVPESSGPVEAIEAGASC